MAQDVTDELPRLDVMKMTTQVVAAYVGRNSVDTAQIPEVIESVYSSIARLNRESEIATNAELKPAVPISKSVTPDYVVCLEDGKKFKMLKRHLRISYGLTPGGYRAKWGLSADYPMVAPNYAKRRSAFAKKMGLGRRHV